MYKFIVTDLSGTVHYVLQYFPDQEPQYVQVQGEGSHQWCWNIFEGKLTKDGSDFLVDGGHSITVQRWEDPI
jgi:hypothetical protein